jgi:hypothetical protein
VFPPCSRCVLRCLPSGLNVSALGGSAGVKRKAAEELRDAKGVRKCAALLAPWVAQVGPWLRGGGGASLGRTKVLWLAIFIHHHHSFTTPQAKQAGKNYRLPSAVGHAFSWPFASSSPAMLRAVLSV